MFKEGPIPFKGIDRPVFQRDQHRPKGNPIPREAKSQEAQLESNHQHGTRKDRKTGITKKIGLTDQHHE